MRVRNGRVQKKNNWRPDRSDYFAVRQDEVRVDRRAPGRGHRHLITVAQLRAFLELLPDWEEVAVGLDAIVLATNEPGCMGWHYDGVVAVCAWEQTLWWTDAHPAWAQDELLDRLGVDRVKVGGRLEVRWTEEQARAYQLLDVLPHELGHHHDRMTTRSKRRAARGEPYAERYASRVLDVVWPAYVRRFGV